jgi:Xaa-Pro aminopeptidase
MTLRGRDAIAKALPRLKVLAVNDAVGPSRIIKDELEVGAICQAIKIAQDAFRALIARGRKGFVGRTERAVAAELDYLMRQAGADKSSFDTIVAAGPHGSLPHYRPGDTRIKAGDPVLIDWGAKLRGYCSDLTRVVFTGTIPPELAAAYEATLDAQAAGIKAVKAGISLKSPDSAARAALGRAGLAEKFVHGLGHGIGLEIHEAPGLAQTASGRLKAGMVVTVEPGVYLPGIGGIRIEDDILVTKQGSVRLSTLSSRLKDMLLK